MVPHGPRARLGPGARVAVVAFLVELVAVGEEEAEVLEEAVGEPGEVAALLGVVTMTLALVNTFDLKIKVIKMFKIVVVVVKVEYKFISSSISVS